jgi:hypothetical protein
LIVDSISIPYSEGAQASQNNFNDSKISLHFRKDCGIFCEGEWEQIIKRDGIAIINKNKRNNLQLSDISLIGLTTFGLLTINGFVGLVGLIDFIGHISLISHNGLFGFGLDNHNGFVNIFSIVSIGFVGLNCLVGQVSLINLLALLNHWPIGLIGIISFGLIGLSASAVLLAHWPPILQQPLVKSVPLAAPAPTASMASAASLAKSASATSTASASSALSASLASSALATLALLA